MTRKEFRDLTDPETAREVVAGLDVDAGTESVPLADADGRVLAERIDAPLDVPGFDRAAMDGYAVRAADTAGASDADPAVLALVGERHAGDPPGADVGHGEAVETSTGAPLPDGADAVVMVEHADERDGQVAVRGPVHPGEHVTPAGDDVAAGDRALGPGTRLSAREVGLLAALGVESVPVRARPAVAVVSTGTELVRPGDPLDHARGQVHDVNSHSVAAAVRAAGGDPVVYPHAPDATEGLAAALREAAADCDLVLSSGSTSASAVDVVYRVVEETGELLLHGVAIKPGKPMLVGTVAGTPYVGLPGYPVSALSAFREFVAPLIRDAAGRPEPAAATVTGRLAERVRHPQGRERLLAVGLVEDGGGDRLVYPVDRGSGATTTLTAADGTVRLAAGTDAVAAGTPVDVSLFDPDAPVPSLLVVGEPDPALSRALDACPAPRFLPTGSREAARRLDAGVPDVAVVAGETDPDGEPIARWRREWGLAVPDDDADVGLGALVDAGRRLAVHDESAALADAVAAAFDSLATDRGADADALRETVTAGVGTRGLESPARAVARGDADAGVALRETAARLGLGFAPLGVQSVAAVAVPDRAEKPGVAALRAALTDDDTYADLPGVTR